MRTNWEKLRFSTPIGLEAAWRLLISQQGLELWLGGAPEMEFAKGEKYQLADGSAGEVRVFSPGSHLRLTWQPPGWERPSTIQVRAIPKGDRTVVAFHQEHLPDADARRARRAHFQAALDALESLIESQS